MLDDESYFLEEVTGPFYESPVSKKKLNLLFCFDHLIILFGQFDFNDFLKTHRADRHYVRTIFLRYVPWLFQFEIDQLAPPVNHHHPQIRIHKYHKFCCLHVYFP